MFFAEWNQDNYTDNIKPVVVIEGHFFKPNYIHPPTHYLYKVPWAKNMFILDPLFIESKTTLCQHRFSHFTPEVTAEILKRIEKGMQSQYEMEIYHSGIIYNLNQDVAIVTSTYINAKIHEYWVDHPTSFPPFATAAEIYTVGKFWSNLIPKRTESKTVEPELQGRKRRDSGKVSPSCYESIIREDGLSQEVPITELINKGDDRFFYIKELNLRELFQTRSTRETVPLISSSSSSSSSTDSD